MQGVCIQFSAGPSALPDACLSMGDITGKTTHSSQILTLSGVEYVDLSRAKVSNNDAALNGA